MTNKERTSVKKQEKAEVSSTETEEKIKKEKAKKQKKRTFQRIVLSICLASLISIAASSAVSFWFTQQNILKVNKINKEQTLDVYSKLINVELELLPKDINHLANIISNNKELLEMNDESMKTIENLAAQYLPNALDYKIFLFGRYDLDTETYPPVNFATQKQLLHAETSELALPEFYNHAKGNYFSLAKAIKNPETKELLFSLVVRYPESILLSSLPTSSLENTQVSLVQSFERGAEQIIFSSGVKNNGKDQENRETSHPMWEIKYQSNQQEHLIKNALTSIAISALTGVIIMLAAILFFMNLLQKYITSDISLIFEFVRSANKKTIPSNLFKTDLLKRLHIELRSLDLENHRKKVKNSSTSASKNSFDVDVDIASGDENLFGGEHEVSTERNTAKSAKKSSGFKLNASIFRAYDIRGIVDETLNAETVKLIGQAIGSEVLKQGESSVIIARDGRLSGPTLSKALSDGILASGADVIDIGMVPTPVLYFACKTLDARSGVMLTGSHNPSNHNGLKIVINGVTLAQEAIQKLRENIENKNLSEGEGQLSEADVLPAYIDAIENDVILAQPLNVVIDCGNGVTGVIAEKLFEQIGCNVTPLYTEVDGNFPNHHPDPSQPANLQDLITKVQETGAHLGIAFDGDGDRVGIVSNKGKIIWPDRLMMLFSKDILLRSPGADIIFDVKCSNTLAETIRKQGGRPLMWKTGHSLIKAKLTESGAQLAGEMSGHIFFNDRWYGFDDGLYSAARLMEILSTDAKSCDDIFAEFPEMVSTPEINIAVDDEGKFDIVSVLASLGDFGEGSKTDIDGIRIDYADGWGLVRASNTTANLVTRFEAKTSARLAEIQAVFKTQLLKIQSDLEIPF